MNTCPIACPNFISVGGDTWKWWNQGTICTKSCMFTQNIINLLEIFFLAVCNYALNRFWFPHPPPSPPPTCDLVFFLVHHFVEDSDQAASDSNLQSLFNKATYNASSSIDYSKEPLDARVVDHPLAHTYILPLPIPITTQKGHPCTMFKPGLPLLVRRWRGASPATLDGRLINTKWTRSFLHGTHCPPMWTLSQPFHITRYSIAYAKLHFPFPRSSISFVCHKFWSSSSNWPPYVVFQARVQSESNPFQGSHRHRIQPFLHLA